VPLFRRKSDGELAPSGEATGAPAGPSRIVGFQSFFSRLVATGGIIGIGTGVAAIMGTQDVDTWIIGIVTAGVSVLLAAVVWSSRGL
jgi:hypothetical protein